MSARGPLRLSTRSDDNPAVAAVPQPAGTVTLVFTDIEGSTRLLEQLGTDGYREALAEHRRVVRQACARHEGYEVDTEGDAFFYAFQSAQHAVQAIAEAMTGLHGGPIKIRVGIHTGEPALDPPNYLGLDVHRAARIMSAAHGGQVVLSPSTVGLLDGTVTLEPLGEHRLKDLTAPIALSQLLIDELPTEFPPLKTLYRSNLPVPATPFIGRERELAEVVSLMRDPSTRMLTLLGPGGTGKTRLAVQAAAELSEDFPDGIWWVPVAPVRDPMLVLPAIAGGLGVKERMDEPLAQTLGRSLERSRTLIVLDNLEHVMPDAAVDLGRLADACPTLRLLVTSRARLALRAERVLHVPAMTPSDGEQLFVESARAAGVELQVDDPVRELCRRVDELPLAIRLAAARTRVLAPAAILERLDRRLPVLESTDRDVDERQRTLEATIAWSYDLLTIVEQRVFRALSVFAGGCTLEAAEAVADAGLDTIQALLDQSLINHRIDEADRSRYWMLETVREYGEARLEECGELEAVCRAHSHAYAELLAPLWPSVRDFDDAGIAALNCDLENGRLALRTALGSGDAPTAASLLLILHLPLLRQGSHREALALAEQYLALDREGLAPAVRLDGDTGASEILRFAAERQRARVLKRKVLELARAHPDVVVLGGSTDARRLIPAMLTDLAELEVDAGDLGAARAFAQEALELRRRDGAARGIAHALSGVAYVALVEGEFDAAADNRAEAADLLEKAGSPEVNVHRAAQSEAELLRGRPKDAARLLAEHLPLTGTHADVLELIYWLLSATYVLEEYERHAESVAVAQAAHALLSETGLKLTEFDAERLTRACENAMAACREEGVEPRRNLTPADALEVARSSLDAILDHEARPESTAP